MRTLTCCIFSFAIAATGWAQFGQPQEFYIPAQISQAIYRSQQTPATCWAACNSMLLAAEGIDSSEADQVQRMSAIIPTAGLQGAGAHFGFASQALRGQYGTRTIQPWFLDRRVPPVNPQMNALFVGLLRQGKPVMVATPQHGMVAIGVKCVVYPNGFHELLAIQVLDPNPQVGGARWLPLPELQAVFGFMAIP